MIKKLYYLKNRKISIQIQISEKMNNSQNNLLSRMKGGSIGNNSVGLIILGFIFSKNVHFIIIKILIPVPGIKIYHLNFNAFSSQFIYRRSNKTNNRNN